MTRRKVLQVGDVFALPVSEDRVVAGQVVGRYGADAYYFAIFDASAESPDALDIAAILRQRLMFLVLSFDAKLANGDWPVIGSHSVSQELPMPAYRVGVGFPPVATVEDWTGTRSRPATQSEAETLPARKFVAPVRIEKAVKAKHGVLPWHESYTELAPATEAMTTAGVFR